jgi:UDP-glucose 4,6-dehydratase
MKILVTGGCGFIASAFCRRLIKQFHYLTLVNIDYLYPCATVAKDLTTSHGNYTFIEGDIKDKELIEETLEKYKIDTIIHFAAQSHVDTSFTNPILYTQDNVLGTHTLLEASRKYGKIKKFIHISTDEVYGENHHEEGAKTEDSLLKPTNPYAASKAGAEMMVHSYIHSYNLPAIVIRSNNIYGPGQYPEKVVPRFILQLLDNQKLTIQGSGNQLRSFLHVEDAVDAVLCIVFQGEIGEIYNISSNDEISIRELATRLLAILKPSESLDDWMTYIEDRNFNDKRYWIQSEPLKRLGWKQKVPLDEGLKGVVEWFKACDTKTYWSGVSKKKALVWGSKGWIGGLFTEVLQQRGWTVIPATSRADDPEAVLKEVKQVRPTHMVSLIGRTHGPGFATIDYLEQKGKLKENITDNLYGPLVLADIAKQRDLHMLYMGTGCIFEYDDTHKIEEGENGQGFTEESLPNFFGSGYSTVKGFTDRLLSNNSNVLNVRIRMPIHSQDGPRNFITKIIQYPKICSIPNSMTVLDEILPVLAEAMERKITGTLNATNPGLIDHHTILEKYKSTQNPSHTWEEISNSDLVTSYVKGARSNNFLDTTRITTFFPGKVSPIQDAIFKILEENKFEGRKDKS